MLHDVEAAEGRHVQAVPTLAAVGRETALALATVLEAVLFHALGHGLFGHHVRNVGAFEAVAHFTGGVVIGDPYVCGLINVHFKFAGCFS